MRLNLFEVFCFLMQRPRCLSERFVVFGLGEVWFSAADASRCRRVVTAGSGEGSSSCRSSAGC